jgi:tetratricopeptide (TPR) repeat protein
MKVPLLVALLSASLPALSAAQATRARAPQLAATAPDKVAQAYEQFLIGHHLEESDDVPGAIAAYRKAMTLDPLAADIPAELAALFFRHERTDEAVAAAQQALKVAPANPEAHRVLGLIDAAKVDNARQGPGAPPDPNVSSAIGHLEKAVANPEGEADPNARGTLARLYLRSAMYDKAIPLLVDLVRQQPGWTEGPRLLAQAYATSGRVSEAIQFLEEQSDDDPSLLPALGQFYEQEQRWKDAAGAYGRALEIAPRNTDLQTRYAQALLNTGDHDDLGKARDTLSAMAATGNDARALYLLSQADRRLGDLPGAVTAARRVITVQDSSPWGYYALTQALEQQQQFSQIVDALTPAIAKFHSMSGDHSLELGMLLPHIGFAHQQLGDYEAALASFEEAHKLSPKDAAVTGYLIEANIAAKQYPAAAELAKQARTQNPNDLRLAELEAQALREDGRADQGIAVLEDAVKAHADEPMAYVALAELYSGASRGAEAVKLLQNAQAKFPADTSIVFELGAVFDKQKDFAKAEETFRQVLSKEPDNAGALNYLGYMLADRGERLDESVGYLKKALEIEPGNGSFLDSLGWAYFKAGKLDLAEDNLRRAAEQLKTNSVIQDHYGQLLFKMGRFDDAIGAWNRALSGDGDSIKHAEIDKKIRDAKQKLNHK